MDKPWRRSCWVCPSGFWAEFPLERLEEAQGVLGSTWGATWPREFFWELRVLHRIISKYSNSSVFLTQGERENMLSLEPGRILPKTNDPTGKAQPLMWLMGRRALFSLFRSGFRQDTQEMRRWLFQTQLFLPLCHSLAP